jgi:hypothetical protein
MHPYSPRSDSEIPELFENFAPHSRRRRVRMERPIQIAISPERMASGSLETNKWKQQMSWIAAGKPSKNNRKQQMSWIAAGKPSKNNQK